MWWCLCLALLVQDPQAPASQPQELESPHADPAPRTGPMRLELTRLEEDRRVFIVRPTGKPPESELQIGMRLAGLRTKHVHRLGRLIFDELRDDTGKSLIDPSAYGEKDRSYTQIASVREKMLGTGLPLGEKVAVPDRAARTLQTVRGSLRVIYAVDYEEITIHDPLQFRGQVIEHPRLRELGLEMRMLPAGTPGRVPNNDAYVAIQFVSKLEHIRAFDFHDEWMRALRNRLTAATTPEGEPCVVYQVLDGMVTRDSQLVIQVYPEIEDVRETFEFRDVELP